MIAEIWDSIKKGIQDDTSMPIDEKNMLLGACQKLENSTIDENMPINTKCENCNADLVNNTCPINCFEAFEDDINEFLK